MKKTNLLLLPFLSFLAAISLHGQNAPVLNNEDQSSSPLMMFGEEEKSPTDTTTDPRSTASRGDAARGAASVDSSSDAARGTASGLAEEGKDESSLTLQDFRDALVQNPTSARFVIVEDEENEGALSIQPRAADTSKFALNKNKLENTTITEALRELLVTRHGGSLEMVNSFFDEAGNAPLSADQLHNILIKSDTALQDLQKVLSKKTPPAADSESDETSIQKMSVKSAVETIRREAAYDAYQKAKSSLSIPICSNNPEKISLLLHKKRKLIDAAFIHAKEENTEFSWKEAHTLAISAEVYWDNVLQHLSKEGINPILEKLKVEKNYFSQIATLADTNETALNSQFSDNLSNFFRMSWMKKINHSKEVFSKAKKVASFLSTAIVNFKESPNEETFNIVRTAALITGDAMLTASIEINNAGIMANKYCDSINYATATMNTLAGGGAVTTLATGLTATPASISLAVPFVSNLVNINLIAARDAAYDVSNIMRTVSNASYWLHNKKHIIINNEVSDNVSSSNNFDRCFPTLSYYIEKSAHHVWRQEIEWADMTLQEIIFCRKLKEEGEMVSIKTSSLSKLFNTNKDIDNPIVTGFFNISEDSNFLMSTECLNVSQTDRLQDERITPLILDNTSSIKGIDSKSRNPSITSVAYYSSPKRDDYSLSQTSSNCLPEYSALQKLKKIFLQPMNIFQYLSEQDQRAIDILLQKNHACYEHLIKLKGIQEIEKESIYNSCFDHLLKSYQVLEKVTHFFSDKEPDFSFFLGIAANQIDLKEDKKLFFEILKQQSSLHQLAIERLYNSEKIDQINAVIDNLSNISKVIEEKIFNQTLSDEHRSTILTFLQSIPSLHHESDLHISNISEEYKKDDSPSYKDKDDKLHFYDKEVYFLQNKAYQLANEAFTNYRRILHDPDEPALSKLFEKTLLAYEAWDATKKYCEQQQSEASIEEKTCWNSPIAIASREVQSWEKAIRQFAEREVNWASQTCSQLDLNQDICSNEPSKEDLRKFPFSVIRNKFLSNQDTASELKREVRILDTMFQYPFIRIEELIHPTDNNRIMARTDMIANQLQLTEKEIGALQYFSDELKEEIGKIVHLSENKDHCLFQFNNFDSQDFPPKDIKDLLDQFKLNYEPNYLLHFEMNGNGEGITQKKIPSKATPSISNSTPSRDNPAPLREVISNVRNLFSSRSEKKSISSMSKLAKEDSLFSPHTDASLTTTTSPFSSNRSRNGNCFSPSSASSTSYSLTPSTSEKSVSNGDSLSTFTDERPLNLNRSNSKEASRPKGFPVMFREEVHNATTTSWNLEIINAPEAWNILENDGERETASLIPIAFLDSGVDFDLFKEHMWHKTIDGHSIHGCNYANGPDNMDYNITDNHGHGTFMTGITSTVVGHQERGRNLSKNVKYMICKISENGCADSYKLMRALEWAINNKAKIINCSNGWYRGTPKEEVEKLLARYDQLEIKSKQFMDQYKAASTEYKDTLSNIYYNERITSVDPKCYEIFDTLDKKDVIIVTSSGHKGTNNDDPKHEHYPSNYGTRYKNIISVAPTTREDKLWQYSNHGNSINIGAPGVEISSVLPSDGSNTFLRGCQQSRQLLVDDKEKVTGSEFVTERLIGNIQSGSSAAAAHASGACALIRQALDFKSSERRISNFPKKFAMAIIQRLTETTDPINDRDNDIEKKITNGRINIANSLKWNVKQHNDDSLLKIQALAEELKASLPRPSSISEQTMDQCVKFSSSQYRHTSMIGSIGNGLTSLVKGVKECLVTPIRNESKVTPILLQKFFDTTTQSCFDPDTRLVIGQNNNIERAGAYGNDEDARCDYARIVDSFIIALRDRNNLFSQEQREEARQRGLTPKIITDVKSQCD